LHVVLPLGLDTFAVAAALGATPSDVRPDGAAIVKSRPCGRPPV